MKKLHVRPFFLVLGIFMLGVTIKTNAQDDWEKVLNLRGNWKFSIGDSKKWADPKFIDSDWETIDVPSNWEDEGFNGYNGHAWYRKTFDGTELDKNLDFSLFLGTIDDVDEVFLNGHKVGFSGTFPPKYHTAYNAFRNYYLPKEYINFNGKNLLAVHVFDSEGAGGIVSGDVGIFINENDRDLTINLRGVWDFALEARLYKNTDDNEFLGNNKHTPPVDSKWTKINVPGEWEHQGYNNFDGTGWYRKQFVIPETLDGEDLVLLLGKVDDFDHTYLNGRWLGSTNWYDRSRIYTIPSDLFNGGAVNILLVYVKDSQGRGGIFEGPIGIMKQSDFTRYYRQKNR